MSLRRKISFELLYQVFIGKGVQLMIFELYFKFKIIGLKVDEYE